MAVSIDGVGYPRPMHFPADLRQHEHSIYGMTTRSPRHRLTGAKPDRAGRVRPNRSFFMFYAGSWTGKVPWSSQGATFCANTPCNEPTAVCTRPPGAGVSYMAPSGSSLPRTCLRIIPSLALSCIVLRPHMTTSSCLSASSSPYSAIILLIGIHFDSQAGRAETDTLVLPRVLTSYMRFRIPVAVGLGSCCPRPLITCRFPRSSLHRLHIAFKGSYFRPAQSFHEEKRINTS